MQPYLLCLIILKYFKFISFLQLTSFLSFLLIEFISFAKWSSKTELKIGSYLHQVLHFLTQMESSSVLLSIFYGLSKDCGPLPAHRSFLFSKDQLRMEEISRHWSKPYRNAFCC